MAAVTAVVEDAEENPPIVMKRIAAATQELVYSPDGAFVVAAQVYVLNRDLFSIMVMYISFFFLAPPMAPAGFASLKPSVGAM
jgi:hypothetical protein